MSVLRYLWFHLVRLAHFAVPILCARLAAHHLPTALAAIAGMLLGGALASIGALLLMRSKVGEITWRNQVAAWCMPWGGMLGPGKLQWIALSSSIIWTLIYWATLTIEVTSGFSSAAPWLLLATWLVLGWCVQKVLGTLLQNFALSSSSGQNLLKILGVLSSLLVLSLSLQVYGRTTYALWVAAAPIIIVGIPYAIFILSIVTFGRNARWN